MQLSRLQKTVSQIPNHTDHRFRKCVRSEFYFEFKLKSTHIIFCRILGIDPISRSCFIAFLPLSKPNDNKTPTLDIQLDLFNLKMHHIQYNQFVTANDFFPVNCYTLFNVRTDAFCVHKKSRQSFQNLEYPNFSREFVISTDVGRNCDSSDDFATISTIRRLQWWQKIVEKTA